MAQEITEFLKSKIAVSEANLKHFKERLIHHANEGDLGGISMYEGFLRNTMHGQDIFQSILQGLSDGQITASQGEKSPLEEETVSKEEYRAVHNDRQIAYDALWRACAELNELAAAPSPENMSNIHDRLWRTAK